MGHDAGAHARGRGPRARDGGTGRRGDTTVPGCAAGRRHVRARVPGAGRGPRARRRRARGGARVLAGDRARPGLLGGAGRARTRPARHGSRRRRAVRSRGGGVGAARRRGAPDGARCVGGLAWSLRLRARALPGRAPVARERTEPEGAVERGDPDPRAAGAHRRGGRAAVGQHVRDPARDRGDRASGRLVTCYARLTRRSRAGRRARRDPPASTCRPRSRGRRRCP